MVGDVTFFLPDAALGVHEALGGRERVVHAVDGRGGLGRGEDNLLVKSCTLGLRPNDVRNDPDDIACLDCPSGKGMGN